MPTRLKCRKPSNARSQVLAEAAPRKLTAGTKAQMRATELLAKEIRFIPAAEFEDLEGDNGAICAVVALLESLKTQAVDEREAARVDAGLRADGVAALRGWNSGAPLLSCDQEQLLFGSLNLLRFRAHRLRSRLSPSSPSKKAMDEIDRMLELVEQIRSQLVNSNLRLVSSIARKFSNQTGDVDDLSSDGCMILLGAIDRFDYSRGFRFSTYATHSIQRHFFRAWKLKARRKERFANAPSELLAEIPSRGSEESICDDPEAVVGNLLAQADSALDEREHQILLSRFGLRSKNSSSRTLREIAADMGISKERVRQLQVKALQKLRELLSPEQRALIETAG